MPRRRSRKGRRSGRMPAVNQSHFAMIPRHDVARSAFNRRFAHKTTFDSSFLIPVYVDEVLPGDHFKCKMTAFTRLATPLFPLMDNLHLSSFFFFVPNRLLWDNWQKFCGEQESPGDSIDFLIPQIELGPGVIAGPNTIYDYMGIPGEGQRTSAIGINALFLRAYNLIWNEWFRDQNLQDPVPVPKDDGPDAQSDYGLLRRGKRHDYFTSCLPWPQKGEAVTLGLAGQAPVRGLGVNFGHTTPVADVNVRETQGPRDYPWAINLEDTVTDVFMEFQEGTQTANPAVYADLGATTATTVNALRQAFQIQRLLERDARGGTRYIELLQSHFGVAPPDMRLQRPEFLGGGSTPVVVNPVAQTSATGVDGSSTPLGELGGIGTSMVNRHGFSQAFTEHGVILGLIAVRADLTYQQGLKRMWSRRTRYDFYWPVFSHLGEQAVLQKEIFATGEPEDDTVFGYQERWAEYRYLPSMVSGFFRSTVPSGTLDPWHLSQRFANAPVLDAAFIEDNPPMERVLAVGSEANGKQFLFDSFFEIRTVRPMPTYSVPGWVDHF